MDRDFVIGSLKFKLAKIDAIKQYHVARRVSPFLADMLPAVKGLKSFDGDIEKLSQDEKLDSMAKILSPIAKGLSQLSDKDSELVLFSLLSGVEVYQEKFKTWSKLASEAGLMIQDIELPVLLQVAGRAFMYNLSGFFPGLPQ